MTTDRRASIESLRDRITAAESLPDRDRELLLEFSDELDFRASEYSDERHQKLLNHLAILAGVSERYDDSQLPDTPLHRCLEDEDATKDLVRWIHTTPLINSPETDKDYRIALRVFGNHVTDGDDPPPSIDIISATTPRDYDPSPDPSKMYWWDEHVEPIIEAATNLRNRAAWAVGWDLGGRSGEFRDLTIGDISEHRHGTRVTVDGKTGQRSVLLIPSQSYLDKWLAVHPRSDDPEAPLWCGLKSGDALSYRGELKMLKAPARRADITLPDEPTFTRLRKSRASQLASEGLSQAVLEDRQGWTRGSDAAARYISVFAEAREREVAAIHGIDVETESSDAPSPIECPRCGATNPPNAAACEDCTHVLDAETARVIEATVERLEDAAVGAADAQTRADAIDAAREIRRDPDRFDSEALHELAASLPD
jgi:integrase